VLLLAGVTDRRVNWDEERRYGVDWGDALLVVGLFAAALPASSPAPRSRRVTLCCGRLPASPSWPPPPVCDGGQLACWVLTSTPLFAPDLGRSFAARAPFRRVRHPGYLGAYAYQAGAVLVFGWWPPVVRWRCMTRLPRSLVGLTIGVFALLPGCAGSTPPEAGSTEGSTAGPTATTDPGDRYRALLEQRGLEDQATSEEELPTVAANICDNTVSEMESLVDGLLTLEPGPVGRRRVLDEKATVVDAFCPQTRLQLDAAVKNAGLEPTPAPE
jgi:hypothetical protein